MSDPSSFLFRAPDGIHAGQWQVMHQGMPLCAPTTLENARAVAARARVTLPDVFWNGAEFKEGPGTDLQPEIVAAFREWLPRVRALKKTHGSFGPQGFNAQWNAQGEALRDRFGLSMNAWFDYIRHVDGEDE